MAVGDITQTEFGPITEIAAPVVAAPQEREVTWEEIPEDARSQLIQQQQSAASIPGETEISITAMPEDALYDLADKQQFNLRAETAANPDWLKDNETLRKLARVNARIKDRGFKFKDVAATPDDPDPGILGGAWNIAKKAVTGGTGFAKGVALNASNLLTFIPAIGAAVTPGGITPKQAFEATQTAMAETGAALESGATGAIEGAGTAATKAGRFFGSVTKYADRPENERLADFLNDVDKEKLRESRIAAQGPFMQAIGGEVIKGLEEKGIGPDPERIAQMAGTDPLSLFMFGKVFSGVHKAGSVAAPLVKPIEKAVSEVSKKAVGLPIAATGLVVEKTAKPLAATAGAVKGGQFGGVAGALIGGERGLAAGRQVAKGAKAVKEFGSQVAGISPLESTAALGTRAVLDAFPKFLTDTATGAGIDLAFIAATTETPDEAGQMPLLGTAFGAGKGVLSGARQAAISTKFAPDFWKHPDKWSVPFTPDESFSGLSELHKATLKTAPDTQVARVNATQNFLQQQKSDAPVYFINDEARLTSALEQIYARQGVTDASERAQFAAKQNGVFTENIVDDSGRPRRVVIAKNPDAVPHEGFHGIQAVLGEAGNRPIDVLTFKAYEDVWEQQGENHARQLTAGKLIPAGQSWREVIKNATGTESPDVYLARELAAENFDYLFRAGLDRPKGLPGKLADIVLNLTDLFGTSPLASERSPVLGIEPRLELVEGIRERVAPAQVAARARKGGKPPPVPAPEKAKQWVADNPTGIPERDAAIQALADAVNTGQGVTVLYWGAKGEPAGSVASIRPERRAQIEAQRQAENANRRLANKVIFPYRVDMTKSGPQFIGWSPDNFRANVAKFEQWLASTGQSRPMIPYDFDASTGKLSTAGRTALEADLQTFISNQRAGFTGSGQPLIVPPEVISRGFTQPEQIGKAIPLDQSKADVINYLFNIQIPESISRVAPLHLAGQEVSAATKPGRLAKPVRLRGTYPAEKLSKAGIPGPREVLEVNPFRQLIERVSADTGIARPSLIEVSQRLNVPRIEASAPAAGEPAFSGNVLTLASGFQPAAQMKRLIEMPQAEWKNLTDNYKGRLGSNLTGWAWDIGASAKTVEDVLALRQAALYFQDASKLAMRAARESAEPMEAMNAAMELVGRGQAAREAFEAATGRNLEDTNAGSAVPAIRKFVDPDYQPPVPSKPEQK